MDQPATPSPQWSSSESIIAYIVGTVATLFATFLRGRFMAKARRAKADEVVAVAAAAAEPNLQKENIAWTKELIEDRQAEVEKLREQLAKEFEHRMKCMEQIATLREEVAVLKAAVSELRRQIEGGQKTDVR